ncbi:MAG: glycosyltransferase family 39 protein [Chloroflexota bacterium]
MAIIKVLVRLSRKEYFWVTVLTLFVLAMHFSIIYYPDAVVTDEYYYVNDARHTLNGEIQFRAEHPPLGQLFIITGMRVFGDNPLGWRFFSVIMGSAGIFLLYLICQQLALSRRAAFLAGVLLALENLTFIQSSLAMLDVFTVCFMLLAFWLYLRGDYPLAAVAGSFSVLTKLSGVLLFLAIGLHWLIMRRDRWRLFVLSMALAPLLFLTLLPIFNLTLTGLPLDPLKRIHNMLTLSGSLTFDISIHPWASRPWEWLISLKTMDYDLPHHYQGVISPTLWALIIPTVGYMAYLMKKHSPAAMFGVLWFASTYLVWLPLELITNRITYIYYFYPAVGAVCIGLAIGLGKLLELGQTRSKLRLAAVSIFCLYLVLHAVVFVLLTPVFSRWFPAWPRLL